MIIQKTFVRAWSFVVLLVIVAGLVCAPVMADQGEVTFIYDAAGRLLQANYGSGAGISYHYDSAGNLVSITPAYDIYLPLILRRSP